MKFRNILLTTFAASAFVIGTTSCSDSFLDEKKCTLVMVRSIRCKMRNW